MKRVQIIISAIYHDADDIEVMFTNWYNEYPEFSEHMVEIDYQQNDEDFMVTFEGLINNFDIDEFMSLSHHAEGLYDGTDLEYFSVEPKIITHFSPRTLEILKINKEVSYPAIFDASGEGITVTFPDFKYPDLITSGEVMEEAHKNAEYELAKYLVDIIWDRELPKASDIDQIKIDESSEKYVDIITVNPLEYAIDNV